MKKSQVWFSNRRARLRKQMSSSSTGTSSYGSASSMGMSSMPINSMSNLPALGTVPYSLPNHNSGHLHQHHGAAVSESTHLAHQTNSVPATGTNDVTSNLYSTPSPYATPSSPTVPAGGLHSAASPYGAHSSVLGTQMANSTMLNTGYSYTPQEGWAALHQQHQQQHLQHQQQQQQQQHQQQQRMSPMCSSASSPTMAPTISGSMTFGASGAFNGRSHPTHAAMTHAAFTSMYGWYWASNFRCFEEKQSCQLVAVCHCWLLKDKSEQTVFALGWRARIVFSPASRFLIHCLYLIFLKNQQNNTKKCTLLAGAVSIVCHFCALPDRRSTCHCWAQFDLVAFSFTLFTSTFFGRSDLHGELSFRLVNSCPWT